MPHEIYIDIETIPDQREGAMDRVSEGVAPPANYKKQETIDKWWEEQGNAAKEEAYRKTALEGTYGQVACIGVAINDGPVVTFTQVLDGSEADVLRETLRFIKQKVGWEHTGSHPYLTWVGHNLVNFDVRYLWQRCVVNGVKPPLPLPIDAKPWDKGIFDTMTGWAGARGYVKLATLCDALGIPVKQGDIEGANVWDAWQAGRYQGVAEYCASDVEATRAVYKRLTFQETNEKEEAA